MIASGRWLPKGKMKYLRFLFIDVAQKYSNKTYFTYLYSQRNLKYTLPRFSWRCEIIFNDYRCFLHTSFLSFTPAKIITTLSIPVWGVWRTAGICQCRTVIILPETLFSVSSHFWKMFPCHTSKLHSIIPTHPVIGGMITTGVKHCTFHWLISSELVQKQRVFSSTMFTCISYGNIFARLLWKSINVAPLKTWIICVTMSDGICNMDYTGLKWSNINEFW